MPLIDPEPERATELSTATVQTFEQHFLEQWSTILRAKIGLPDQGQVADQLVADFLTLLRQHQMDTRWLRRRLADAAGDEVPLRTLFGAPQPRWMGGFCVGARIVRNDARRAAQGPSPWRRSIRWSFPATTRSNARWAASEHDDLRPFRAAAGRGAPPLRTGAEGDNPYIDPASREQTACYRTFCGTSRTSCPHKTTAIQCRTMSVPLNNNNERIVDASGTPKLCVARWVDASGSPWAALRSGSACRALHKLIFGAS